MSTLSGDFYGFDDLFSPQEEVHQVYSRENQYTIQFNRMDTILVVPDDTHDSIAMVFHNGPKAKNPGAGAYLTVGQAIRVIKLLRDCIVYIEQGGVSPRQNPLVPGEDSEEEGGGGDL